MIKKYSFLIELILILFICIELTIIYIDQYAVCSYNLIENNYTEKRTIIIKYNKTVSENVIVNSKFIDILKEKRDLYFSNNYNILLNKDELVLNKESKDKRNYYNIIKEYKKNGYSCNIKFN